MYYVYSAHRFKNSGDSGVAPAYGGLIYENFNSKIKNRINKQISYKPEQLYERRQRRKLSEK